MYYKLITKKGRVSIDGTRHDFAKSYGQRKQRSHKRKEEIQKNKSLATSLNQIKMQKYAQLVLRIRLAFVFIWFGYTQVTAPNAWVGLVPPFITNLTGLSAHTFILLNGSLEIVGGILLVFGLFTRIVAFLLFIHMVGIVFNIGFNDIGVRDIGLAVACLSLSFMKKEP